MTLTSADKDRLYNFDCPGCHQRRNYRAARPIAGDPDRAPYCKACANAIEHDGPIPKERSGTTVERIEERGRPIRTMKL